MTTKKELNAIAKKQLAQRETLWPNWQTVLWRRSEHKGFTTMPKTMPLILQAMDEMSNGKPVSDTYFGLWCSTWDNSFVHISAPRRQALAAGFTGERAEYTWGQRMKMLNDFRFIDVKPGDAGPYTYVIILNPHMVIRWHHDTQKTSGLREVTYNMLLQRALDIGAKDMTELPSAPATTTAAAA